MKKAMAIALAVALSSLLVIGTGSAALPSESGGGLSVALPARESSGIARSSEPVTVGVPLPSSPATRSTDSLRVLDPSGNEVPAQFEAAARWGGAPRDGSLPIKWVLVDFQATLGANSVASYRLVNGGSGPPATGLSVTRNDGAGLEVTTGAATFGFSRSAFNIFDYVDVPWGRVIAPGGSTGVVARDPWGGSYATAGAAPLELVLETDGPLRKTVRMGGPLRGPGGDLLDCTARVSLFAGSSAARVQLTVRNSREPASSDGQPQCWDIGCPNSATLSDLSFALDYELGGATARLGGAAGDYTTAGSLEVYQDSSGGPRWNYYAGHNPRPQSYVTFRGYRVERDGSLAGSGDRCEPYIDCTGATGGLALATRGFWENFPKALRERGGRLEAALFPDEYAGDFSFRPGEQKTHELLCYFHAPWFDGPDVCARTAQAIDPLLVSTDTGGYLSSGALGRVGAATGDTEFSSYEQLNRSTLEGEGLDLFHVIEDAGFYGWQDYGEVPVDYEDGGTGTLNHKYNFDYGMLLQFARSGDARWFRLARAAGQHVADLDVLHSSGAVDAWWEGGFYGHSYHDEDSMSNPNRNYGGPHPDLVFGAPGLFLLYYMTGDPVARDTALEISENVRYRFDNTFGRGNGEGFADAPDYDNGCQTARPFANGLLVLLEAFRATGDGRYLDTSRWLIENSHQAVDLFLTSPVGGDRRYTRMFMWDLLEFAMGRYLDVCAEAGVADGCGARDELLAMSRQEAYVMWKTDAAGNQGVPYAWMRDGTPWGWEEQEVAVNVCNWHLLTADALTYGYVYGGDAVLLDRARQAFKTGSRPNQEGYQPVYTATKEATSSANFGLAYMFQRHPSWTPPSSAESVQFNEWICLENPGNEAARATLEYFFGDGGTAAQEVTVPARSRTTVDVNLAVGGGRDVSARVTSDRPVVAERPMYFNYHGSLAGGSDAIGAPAPRRAWYFAEGCTRPGFEQWMTIENPGSESGRVTLTYMLESGGLQKQTVDAPARARVTVDVNGFLGAWHDVSTKVESDVPVVAERPMYFKYHGKWAGGHDSMGVAAPATSWYFAEGTTRNNPYDGAYEQWLCLQNPNAAEAHAHVVFLRDRDGVVERDFTLAPNSRKTIDVNLAIGVDYDTGTVVTSDEPIVAERPQYSMFRNRWDGGDVVVGSTGAGTEWHFAEGCTRDGFQTWLCLGNPQGQEVTARVDYFLGDGRNLSKYVSVPARSRRTLDVNVDVGTGQDVSCRVTSGKPIVAERPMYFNYHGAWPGGHDSMGVAAPATEWNFAEGCTR